jgi:hypothetical protein
MDKRMMLIFREELGLQCKMILAAADDLEESHAADDTWIALQQMLIAAANISKMLWGSKGKRDLARKDLRESIGVTDANAKTIRDPDLRNDWEHFDERLESWSDEAGGRTFMGRNIGGPAANLTAAGDKVFGHFDPISGVVTFWDHSVSVPALVQEARTIQAGLAEARAKAWW